MVSGIAIFNGKLEKVESVWVDEKSLHCIRDDMGINCNETAESQKRLNDVCIFFLCALDNHLQSVGLLLCLLYSKVINGAFVQKRRYKVGIKHPLNASKTIDFSASAI